MQSLKITFLTPHVGLSGGVKMILKYAHLLSKRGHEVTVICPDKLFFMGKNILNWKPKWTELEAKLKYVPSFDYKWIPNGDIVVATAWGTATYAIKYPKEKGTKIYFIQHYESLWSRAPPNMVDETYKYRMRKIVVSSWLKEIMERKFGSSADVIVNPVNFTQYYYTGSREKQQNVRVCMMHHIYKWKGIDDGLKAFKIVKEKHPEIQLVMFGVSRRKIPIDCEYHYNVPESKLKDVYSSCHIYLCPSWYEGLGMPAMEAMACKSALVTTDTKGCRDYAIHEKTALVSPPRKPELLARNIVKLIEDRALMEKIALNGYAKIREFDSWDNAVSKMERIFLDELRN